MRKRYYFTLRKGKGKASVEMYMYLSDGKFYYHHHLHSSFLMNWFQAHWYWMLMNLPGWIKRNGHLFGYAVTNGTVHLRRLENEMLN